VDHIAFGWDSPDGATGQIQPFLEAGFQLMQNEVLATGSASPPPHPNSAVTVRALAQEGEWEQAIQLQLADEARAPSPGLEAFTRLSFARYRAMAEAGRGAWFGAFLGASLAGHLGIFVEDGVGRFQEVVTHPAYRRRGICATLVHQASLVAFKQLGASELVIVADAGSQASRIYQSVGYRPVERQAGLAWWEGIDASGGT
jgi:ribosomal protein S18 acetylase RimI-like enzyme